MDLLAFALFVPVLLVSIVLHELAHAWQARSEGDPTAARLGRITLNPAAHLELFGSFIVPLLLFVSNSGFLFGWARPVPVQPANYRDPKWGDIRVSLAGIAVNLVLAVAFTLAAAVSVTLFGTRSMIGGYAYFTCITGVLLNLILAFFNLIPIPPLDGSHVLYHFLPEGLREGYRAMARYGLLILVGIMFFAPSLIGALLIPVEVAMGWADSFIRLWI